jgi:hypothetical protein
LEWIFCRARVWPDKSINFAYQFKRDAKPFEGFSRASSLLWFARTLHNPQRVDLINGGPALPAVAFFDRRSLGAGDSEGEWTI